MDSSSKIVEEILDLTRDNQKLLRNPDGEFIKEAEPIKVMLEKFVKRLGPDTELRCLKRERKFHPMLIEELLLSSLRFEKNLTGFQLALSLLRTDFPWLYAAGLDVTRTLRMDYSYQEKPEAAQAFYELVEFAFEHPIMRDMYMPDKEMWMMRRV